MNPVAKIKQKVLSGLDISFDESVELCGQPIAELAEAANEIRTHFCGNEFDICTIINAKSGRCSENCKFCAQSSHYKTKCEEYSLLSKEQIFTDAVYNSERGIVRYSLVTSGRSLTDDEVEQICRTVRKISGSLPIRVCGSLGNLSESQYEKLYAAGLKRIHNNLETSRTHFPNICTTHSFDDKIKALESAKKIGMTICSGGIFGIGETFEDRIELAFSLKKLDVKSVPINLLNPIPGTPFERNIPLSPEELRRIVAIYRFILPDSFIRLAGGRGLLPDHGRICFCSGANAAISGDMLTTAGISIDSDMKMIGDLGFEVRN